MTAANTHLASCLEIARTPVSAGQFAGEDIRYSPGFELLESELSKQGALHAAAGPDWAAVVSRSSLLLRHESKDLRIACWYAWGLFQCASLAGLQGGLALLHCLCAEQWEQLHPRKARTRLAPLNWLAERLPQAFPDSTPVREQLDLMRELHRLLQELDNCLSGHLGDQAPLLLPLCRRLDSMIRKAEETPTVKVSPGAVMEQVREVASQLVTSQAAVDSEREAQKQLRSMQDGGRSLCAFWLRHKVSDVRAYRLSRTLLWIGIDALPRAGADNITTLRGLPADRLTNYRERLQQEGYADLLIDLEASIARSPFWLDGQHMAWQCLTALGCEPAAQEIEVQLGLLLRRLPELPALAFHDGQAFADAGTRAWISSQVLPRLQRRSEAPEPACLAGGELPAWEQALRHASDMLRDQGLKPAVQLMKSGLDAVHGGRQRFHWQMSMARLCMQAKKYELAKTQLEALDAALHSAGLAAWEPELVLDVLRLLLNCCDLLPQSHVVRERRDEVYRRLCHLDLEVVLD